MATAKKSSNTTSANPLSPPSLEDLGKLIEQFKLPGIDLEALAEWQRKDMEAFAEANRLAYEGVQALAQRRGEILRDTLAKWQSALSNATDKDALTKQSEAVQQGIQQAVTNFRELAEMEAQAHRDAWKVVQDRMQENMANLQRLLQPKP